MRLSRHGLLVGGLAFIAAAHAGSASEPPSPPPARTYPTEAFARLPQVESPSISPDGTHIAAKVAVGDKQYFAILPIAGGQPRLIGLGETDLNWWRWVDGDWLVLGTGQMMNVGGDEWYIRRILSVNRTGKIVQLSPKESGQNADDVIWVSHDGKPRVLLAYQASIFRDQPGFWPHVDEIDVTNGRHRRVQMGQEGVMDWYADGDGAVRMGVGHGYDGRSTKVLYRPAGKGPWRIIDRARTREETVMAPALFRRDGGALVIADDERGFSALYDLDLTTMKRGTQQFASKDFDIDGLVTDESGFAVAGVRVNEDRPAVRWTDPDMRKLAEETQAMARGSDVAIVSRTPDRRRAILRIGRPDAPGVFMLFDRDKQQVAEIGLVNPVFGMHALNPVRTIRYKARDGLEIAAVLTLPRNGKGRLPLIVMPHGGPFARDTEEWDWWTQFLASRGYAVVQPNYRGSSGYGTAFTAKGQGQWGLAMQDDLNDAVAALASDGVVDPKRVCMVGASYGGYAAMRAAQRDGALYRCAVSYAGVSDLSAMKRYDSRFLMADVRRDWLLKQAPDLAAVSPIAGVGQFSIPVLLVHGVKDRTVPVRQSRTIAQKLKAAGKPVTYIEQPEADHHFSRSGDRLQFLNALDAFLKQHNPA